MKGGGGGGGGDGDGDGAKKKKAIINRSLKCANTNLDQHPNKLIPLSNITIGQNCNCALDANSEPPNCRETLVAIASLWPHCIPRCIQCLDSIDGNSIIVGMYWNTHTHTHLYIYIYICVYY